MSDINLSPTDRIERGIAAREAAKNNPPARFHIAPNSIASIAADHAATLKRNASARASITKALETFDDNAKQRLVAYRTIPTGNGSQRLRSAREMQEYASVIKHERVVLRQQLFHSFGEVLKQSRDDMRNRAEQVAQNRDAIAPLRLAAAFHIGHEKRARLVAEYQLMKPATLKHLADLAKAENDQDAIAALILVNDSLPNAARSFSSADLAEHGFGARSRELGGSMDTIILETQAAVENERELGGAAHPPYLTIETALDKREAEASDV